MDHMRKTMLAEDDPRHSEGGYFVDNPTVDEVLDGIDRLVAKGYEICKSWRPYMVGNLDGGNYYLRGNFADISAAFAVAVSQEDARRVWDRLCAVDVVVRRLKP